MTYRDRYHRWVLASNTTRGYSHKVWLTIDIHTKQKSRHRINQSLRSQFDLTHVFPPSIRADFLLK